MTLKKHMQGVGGDGEDRHKEGTKEKERPHLICKIATNRSPIGKLLGLQYVKCLHIMHLATIIVWMVRRTCKDTWCCMMLYTMIQLQYYCTHGGVG